MACLDEKMEKLRSLLRSMGGAVIAFSGGVDSSLLLRVALEENPGRTVAVHAVSDIVPREDTRLAEELADSIGLPLLILRTDELEDPRFVENSPQRCYHCKRRLFERIGEVAREHRVDFILDGTNADDLILRRPGTGAAEELGVRSPLAEVGLGKEEVRELARRLGLPSADRPSNACLATRIPFGEMISRERLRMVDEAESFLRSLGLPQLRVRHHGTVARIEVPEGDLARLLERREAVIGRLKEIGFVYIAMDLEGFRSGSMEEAVKGSHG